MERSRIDSAALLAAAVAAGLILFVTRAGFSYVSTIGGVTLLFILFSYDQEGKRSVFQSLAFSAVCGFCIMLACGIIFQASLGPKNDALGAAAKEAYFQLRLSATWGFATLVLWAIDRARMSGRTAYDEPQARVGGTRRQAQLIPEFTGSFPAVAVPAPPPSREPEYHPPAPVTPYSAPIPEPTPPPAAASAPEPTPPPAAASAPEPTPPPAAPPPAAVPLPPGKETMIYVNLVGEGLNVLRSVRAEHLGRDFYKITEDVPAGETWEYGPGQVVRCKKQKLSSGKALVAFEEAPRSQ